MSDDHKWRYNLEHHSRGIIYDRYMFIESTIEIIMFKIVVSQLSLTIVIYNSKIFIVQATCIAISMIYFYSAFMMLDNNGRKFYWIQTH